MLRMTGMHVQGDSAAGGGGPTFPGSAAPGGAGSAAAAGGAPHPGGEAKVARGVLITGCQAHETSADACPSGNPAKAFGALTNALTTTVRAAKQKGGPNANVSYRQLVQDVRAVLLQTRFTQNPCLECEPEDADTPFIC
jgi:hypothetical protein